MKNFKKKPAHAGFLNNIKNNSKKFLIYIK